VTANYEMSVGCNTQKVLFRYVHSAEFQGEVRQKARLLCFGNKGQSARHKGGRSYETDL